MMLVMTMVIMLMMVKRERSDVVVGNINDKDIDNCVTSILMLNNFPLNLKSPSRTLK